MKILVTGGCGFLGSNLAQAALARGDEVLVLDDLSRRGADLNLAWLKTAGLAQFRKDDVRDEAAVLAAVRDFRPGAVFHLAGQVAMTTSIEDPRRDFEINALGTLNVLEALRKLAPEAALIYSSTNKVYGNLEAVRTEERAKRFVALDHPAGFDESLPLDFSSPYGCSKGAADQYVLDYAGTFGLRTMVFRHSSMYGTRQFATFDQGWIGWFCQQAIETKRGALKEPFTISGTGKQVRDVLHVEDMIRLYFAAVAGATRGAGRAFNIGGGMANSLSLLELFDLLEELLGVRLAYRRLPERLNDQVFFVANNRAATDAFGWAPIVTAREGIAKMLDWVGRASAHQP